MFVKNLVLLTLIKVNSFLKNLNYFNRERVKTTKLENEILSKLKISGYCVITDFINEKECEHIKKKNKLIY